ncbi:Homeobox protein yox1 [Recurvomyces mirabilis]|uniref:Homeobox protein yox1 n=1 Tax=Recurvomyces mirabilis TaxID=574656 RepID=A0AAE0TSI9_9PEZI|nr:Homeobox protein yox1 [Recurvomyces mirabilis]
MFAVLTPFDPRGFAARTSLCAQNQRWLQHFPVNSSREPTPSLHEDADDDVPGELHLSFSEILAISDLGRGLLFGRSKSAHIHLAAVVGLKGVSTIHCALSVDDKLRICITDYSTFGTFVFLGLAQKQLERHIAMPLTGEPGAPCGDMAIKLGNALFAIQFPEHELGNAAYRRNMQQIAQAFYRGCNGEKSGGTLSSGTSTMPPSSCFTPQVMIPREPISARKDKQKRKRTSLDDQAILEAAYKCDARADKAARLELVKRVTLGEKEVQVHVFWNR